MILLQSQSQNLDQALNTLTESSIQFAQAASDYGALKVIFGVFIVFVLLILLVFFYQIFNLNKQMGEIHKAAISSQKFFEGVDNRTVGVPQAQLLIRRCFGSLSQTIKYNTLRIRLENHIDDKERTLEKVNRVMKNQFKDLDSFLSSFYCNDKPVSVVLTPEDQEVLKNLMIEQIYLPKETFTISNLDQSVNIVIDGIKVDYLSRV